MYLCHVVDVCMFSICLLSVAMYSSGTTFLSLYKPSLLSVCVCEDSTNNPSISLTGVQRGGEKAWLRYVAATHKCIAGTETS